MAVGAFIERGKIKAVEAEGYIVASLDREGIETPPIQCIHREVYDHLTRYVEESIPEKKYTVGDTVYFFLFPDGTGKIISLI